jgi:outer membrane protein TolC
MWYETSVRWLLASMICLAPAIVAAQEQAPVRTLAQLTRAAERSWPGLEAARHQLAGARARLDEATISPFFQLEATAAFTLAPEARGTSTFSPDPQLPLDNPWRPVVSVGVEGAIPLYTFGKLDAARAAARAGVQAAEHQRERERMQVVYDVRRAYYSLQLALDTLQMINEGQGRLEDAVEKLEQRIEEGDPDVNEHDRWRLSTTIAEVEARRSEAERLEATARAALGTLTGVRRFRVPDCPLERIEIAARPLAHYLREAGASRPELPMLSAGLAARRASLSATEARYYPDIALALGASYSYGPGITDQTNPFVVDRANYASLGAALVARWSLDLWGNSYRVERAQSELGETRARVDEARLGIALEVTNAYNELADARRREEAWSRGHRDARSWFVASAQAYQVGALEPRELVDAVKAYFTARFSHLQAIRDHNVAVANLARATGTPLLRAGGWERRCEE